MMSKKRYETILNDYSDREMTSFIFHIKYKDKELGEFWKRKEKGKVMYRKKQ